MRLTNPMAFLDTTPRRLLATLMALILAGVLGQVAISQASGKLTATVANTGNTFAAHPCFATLQISVTNNTFGANGTSTVKAGCSVTWTRVAGNHTTTNSTPTQGSLWNAPLGSGQTFTYTFNTTGSFPYVCTIHASSGMTGTITVN